MTVPTESSWTGRREVVLPVFFLLVFFNEPRRRTPRRRGAAPPYGLNTRTEQRVQRRCTAARHVAAAGTKDTNFLAP